MTRLINGIFQSLGTLMNHCYKVKRDAVCLTCYRIAYSTAVIQISSDIGHVAIVGMAVENKMIFWILASSSL